MAKRRNGNDDSSPNKFRFNLTGLIVLCVCLTAGSLILGAKLLGARQNTAAGPGREMPSPGEIDEFTFSRKGPWGELLIQNINLERPAEYLNAELKTVAPPVWTFHGKNVAQVKALFISNGLTQQEAEKALAPDCVSTQGPNTLVRPSDEFVLSLSPEARTRLYEALRGLDVSPYLSSPYAFSKNSFARVLADARLHADDLALFKKLVCGSKDASWFSDYETLMRRIPSVERRVATTAVLWRQPAVIAALRIRPDTDVDKVVQYWANAPNVRFIDIRPMVESLKRLPNGGAISSLCVLPPFARNHVYTYPLPPKQGEPIPDANWTTFNFSNVTPDNRFLDPAECARHIDQHFYKIAQPALYGDVVVFRDGANQIRHSAVFLADDLVFSKNGKTHTTPWLITRIPDLQAMYPTCTISYLRQKTD
jgi:hypothetical protein